MKIRLKTKNLKISRIKQRDWHGGKPHYVDGIVIPANIPFDLLSKVIYVLSDDFCGIKKNKPLIFYYRTNFNKPNHVEILIENNK